MESFPSRADDGVTKSRHPLKTAEDRDRNPSAFALCESVMQRVHRQVAVLTTLLCACLGARHHWEGKDSMFFC